MSVLVLDSGTRRARKTYRCGMCLATIQPGDFYAFQNNVFDDHAYTWRECLPCHRDAVAEYVYQYFGSPDEGVSFESTRDWAEDAMCWPMVAIGWRSMSPRRMKAGERMAARNWMARAGEATR